MLRFFCPPPPWRRLALLLPLLAALSSCKKDDPDPLPAATQTGANTFGCRLNGEAWVPGGARKMSGEEYKFAALYRTRGPFKFGFTVTSYRQNKEANAVMQFTVNSVDHLGIYPLNRNAAPYPGALPWLDQGGYSTRQPTDREYITSAAHTGTLTITRLDTVAHVIAGTFAFTAGEIGGTRTVSVTDGRFDINYLDN